MLCRDFMMGGGQLSKIIETWETQDVEFKQSVHSYQELSQHMCGLANREGGLIFIGVSPKKEVVGVAEDLDRLQQRIVAAAKAISSPVIPAIEIIRYKGKNVVAITVPKAPDSTYHTFEGVIYSKIGSTLHKFEGQQIAEFLRMKQILSFDETLSTAKIGDLDHQKITDYLNLRKQQDFLTSHSIKDFLVSAKLAAGDGELKIKNAALLFFAKNPMQFSPQMEIKMVRFSGNEPVNIASHELIQTTLVEAIERAMAFVKTNLPKRIEIGEQTQREERYLYPSQVIRESIVNAVAHRDYFSKDAIQIYIFDNRMEITNPGSIPSALPRELFGTLSVQRNPLTYRILRDYNYVEGLGSGVPRMKARMREYGLDDPDFEIYPAFFRVILRAHKTKKYDILNKRQIAAIEFLKVNKTMKMRDYIKLNKVSFGTARLDVNEMIKLRYIKRVGIFRGAYYVLRES